jgi:hypothetical protein
MTMTNCADCGAHMTGEARACPKCGKVKPPEQNRTLMMVALVVVLISVSYFVIR